MTTTLTSFSNMANGQNPSAGLTQDAAGNLYGTTGNGGTYGNGTVFEIDPSTGVLTTLASFVEPASSDGGLTLDAAGNIYGTINGPGGSYGDGEVFEVAAGSGVVSILASFDGADGADPRDGLTLDSAGNLYGTTPFGGAYGDGAVFEVAAGSDAITTLASFNGTNGADPSAGVTLDSAGNLYGTTQFGGTTTVPGGSPSGTVFEIPAGSTSITTLDTFDGWNGATPVGGVTLDSAGNLYGTTSSGITLGSGAGDGENLPGPGTTGHGSVFEIAAGSGVITTLAVFDNPDGTTNASDGYTPLAGVWLDSAANLYSTTSSGGDYGDGTVFEVDRASGAITPLASFSDPSINLGLTVNSAGDLFGTTSVGADGNGTVFELIPSGQSASIEGALQASANGAQQETTTGSTQPIQVQASDQPGLDNLLSAVSQLQVSASGPSVDINIDAGNATYQDTQVSVPPNVTLTLNGATFVGGSPALVVTSGTVIVTDSTLTNSTDAPTILVKGGNLVLSGDTVQQSSTVLVQPAIEVDGGTVDLGSAAMPGDNTLDTEGGGMLIDNTTANPDAVPIDPAAGNVFEMDGTPISTDSGMEGEVWVDFNDDGNVDFGEQGINGVTITLTGKDTLGQPVQTTAVTGTDGIYTFSNLSPGVYSITETGGAALNGFTPGIDSVGTLGAAGTSRGVFSEVLVGQGETGFYYNFGELPAPGSTVSKGQAAGIGFWANKNGQALIKQMAANTALGRWLAATLPDVFGMMAQSSPAQIAAIYQNDFLLKDKLAAQYMATALNVYATDQSLGGAYAQSYGFSVGQYGLGDSTWNVGSDGAAFGVANNTTPTVLQLLQDGQSAIDSANSNLRNLALDLFGGINSKGGL